MLPEQVEPPGVELREIRAPVASNALSCGVRRYQARPFANSPEPIGASTVATGLRPPTTTRRICVPSTTPSPSAIG